MRFLSILPFCGILVIAAALAQHGRCRVELTIPVSMFSIALLLYASGLFGSLLPGLYLCYAIILACVVYLTVCAVKKRLCAGWIFTPGLCFFIAVYAFGLFVHRQETLIGWDESAHWILTLRNSFALNQFGAVAASSAEYKTYPPIVAMFHYFFTKSSILYANTTLRMSVTVLTAGLLAPLLSVFRGGRRDRLWRIVIGFLLFALPFAYYKNAYFGAQVDCIQGLTLSCFLSVFFLSDNPRLRVITAVTGVLFLTLTKDSGLILALIGAVVLAADRLLFAPAQNETAKKRRVSTRDILLALLFLALPLLAKLSWTGFLCINGIVEEASDQLDFWMVDYVKAILSGRFREDYAHSYRVEGFAQFWRSVLYDANFHENTRFWLCGIPVPYSVRLGVSIALGLFSICVADEKKRLRTALTFLLLGNLIWLAGISILYLCRFTEPENAVLSSVSRYLGTGLIAVDTFSISHLLRRSVSPDVCERCEARQRRTLAAVLAAAMILPSLVPMFSQEAYQDYKGRPLLRFEETSRDRVYRSYMTQFDRISSHVTSEDRVLIVAEEVGEGWLWYMHALAPLQKITVVDDAALTSDKLYKASKFYVATDSDASIAAAGASLPADALETGALYEVWREDGTFRLTRLA